MATTKVGNGRMWARSDIPARRTVMFERPQTSILKDRPDHRFSTPDWRLTSATLKDRGYACHLLYNYGAACENDGQLDREGRQYVAYLAGTTGFGSREVRCVHSIVLANQLHFPPSSNLVVGMFDVLSGVRQVRRRRDANARLVDFGVRGTKALVTTHDVTEGEEITWWNRLARGDPCPLGRLLF